MQRIMACLSSLGRSPSTAAGPEERADAHPTAPNVYGHDDTGARHRGMTLGNLRWSRISITLHDPNLARSPYDPLALTSKSNRIEGEKCNGSTRRKTPMGGPNFSCLQRLCCVHRHRHSPIHHSCMGRVDAWRLRCIQRPCSTARPVLVALTHESSP